MPVPARGSSRTGPAHVAGARRLLRPDVPERDVVNMALVVLILVTTAIGLGVGDAFGDEVAPLSGGRRCARRLRDRALALRPPAARPWFRGSLPRLNQRADEGDDLVRASPAEGHARTAVPVAVHDVALALEPDRRAGRAQADPVPQHLRAGECRHQRGRAVEDVARSRRDPACGSTRRAPRCRRRRCRRRAGRRTSARRRRSRATTRSGRPARPRTTCPRTGTTDGRRRAAERRGRHSRPRPRRRPRRRSDGSPPRLSRVTVPPSSVEPGDQPVEVDRHLDHRRAEGPAVDVPRRQPFGGGDPAQRRHRVAPPGVRRGRPEHLGAGQHPYAGRGVGGEARRTRSYDRPPRP